MDPTTAMGGSFAFKLVGNIISGNKAAAQQYQQYTQALQQQQQAWDQNSADNKAIAEANLTNTIRTGYKAGLLNVQRAQAKKKAIEDGYDLSVQREQALGAANANAAAAGTIGSSVAAVTSDIEQKVGEAKNQIADNYDQAQENFDTSEQDLVWQGQDGLRAPRKLSMTTLDAPSGFSLGEAVLGAALDVGSSYMSQKMSLALGKPSGG